MRYRLAALFCFAIINPAFAGPREDTMAGIARCSALADDRQFLNCVYGAAQPLRASLGLSPAAPAQIALVPMSRPTSYAPPMPSAAPTAAAPAAQPAPASGGFFGGLLGTDSLHLTAYSFDRRGQFKVTLSNGQIWRQNPDDSNLAHWGGKASDLWISLTTQDGTTGHLSVRGDTGAYAVQRVQ